MEALHTVSDALGILLSCSHGHIEMACSCYQAWERVGCSRSTWVVLSLGRALKLRVGPGEDGFAAASVVAWVPRKWAGLFSGRPAFLGQDQLYHLLALEVSGSHCPAAEQGPAPCPGWLLLIKCNLALIPS